MKKRWIYTYLYKVVTQSCALLCGAVLCDAVRCGAVRCGVVVRNKDSTKTGANEERAWSGREKKRGRKRGGESGKGKGNYKRKGWQV